MKTKQDTIFSSKTLSYFLQLAETMSYTQAAQILGITQPALTQQIKSLNGRSVRRCFIQSGKNCTYLMRVTRCLMPRIRYTKP